MLPKMIMEPFVTGTAAFGPFTIASDIDIVMYFIDALKLRKVLEASEIETEESGKINMEYSGYYFSVGIRRINVVIVKDETQYEAWKYATERMRKILPVEDRELRIKTFRHYYDIYNRENY